MGWILRGLIGAQNELGMEAVRLKPIVVEFISEGEGEGGVKERLGRMGVGEI